MDFHAITSSAAFKGAVTGALGAAAIDFQAFRSWKSAQDAIGYNWGTALFRWAQGAVIGAVGLYFTS